MRRPICTSSASSESTRRALSKLSRASASWAGLRWAEPLKMTSVISFPRRLLGLWSPRIHLIASTTLLLPEPLGPTTQVTPGAKSKRVRSAKLLKPNRSSDLSIVFPHVVSSRLVMSIAPQTDIPTAGRSLEAALLAVVFAPEQSQESARPARALFSVAIADVGKAGFARRVGVFCRGCRIGLVIVVSALFRRPGAVGDGEHVGHQIGPADSRFLSTFFAATEAGGSKRVIVAPGPRQGVDFEPAVQIRLPVGLHEHLRHIRIRGLQFADRPNHFGQIGADGDLVIAGVRLEAADGDRVAAGRSRDHDMAACRKVDWSLQFLVGAEHDDFGDAKAGKMHHRIALGGNHVQVEFVVHVLAADEIG